MKICPRCGHENDDDAVICKNCGFEFDGNENFEWVLLETAASEFEADIVKNLLESNGVIVMMKRPGPGYSISSPFANPLLGSVGHWDIFVTRDNLDKAKAILSAGFSDEGGQDGTNKDDDKGDK
ncbi:MAG: zinc ribbon domain-containing protein [Caldisericaceae bacterium]